MQFVQLRLMFVCWLTSRESLWLHHIPGQLDRGAALRQTLEPLEGVVYEDPVLVRLARVSVRRRSCSRGSGGTGGGNLRILRSTSGKSSKLEVSSMDLTSTGMAAGRSRMWFQSTPLNQPQVWMSSRCRIRWSISLQNLGWAGWTGQRLVKKYLATAFKNQYLCWFSL